MSDGYLGLSLRN